MSRARVLVMNSALGPLDYRVPHGMQVEPGSIVIAPLGPRQLVGVVWEPERMPSDAEVGDNRLRNLIGVFPAAPLTAPLRRLIEWTADYYLAPPAAVARMALASSSALEGAKTVTEYRATGLVPDRVTPQREQALEQIGTHQGLIRELAAIGNVSDAVIRGLAKVGALEQAVRSAEQLVKSTRRSFEAGSRTLVDILNAEQQLQSTRRDLAQARYLYLISRVRLQALAGGDKEAVITELNGWLAGG